MTLRIYVAGSSEELGRVSCVASCFRTFPGVDADCDWVDKVKEYGNANGIGDVQLEVAIAAKCIDSIDLADMVALVLPRVASQGAAFETGYAFATRKPVVVVRNENQTIPSVFWTMLNQGGLVVPNMPVDAFIKMYTAAKSALTSWDASFDVGTL